MTGKRLNTVAFGNKNVKEVVIPVKFLTIRTISRQLTEIGHFKYLHKDTIAYITHISHEITSAYCKYTLVLSYLHSVKLYRYG